MSTTLNCVDSPVKFLQPLRPSSTVPEVITLEEDATSKNYNGARDSVSCTVEESDLRCPQEEMLDPTVTDEFDVEVGR